VFADSSNPFKHHEPVELMTLDEEQVVEFGAVADVVKTQNRLWETAAMAETHAQTLKRRYGPLRQRQTSSERIYELIRSRPSSDVNEIIRRIRAGTNPDLHVRFIESGGLFMQMTVAPEAHRRQNEFPCLRDMPRHIFIAENPYLPSSEVTDLSIHVRSQKIVGSGVIRGTPNSAIRAALILSYTTTNNGINQAGTTYMQRACEMANDAGFSPAEVYP
jgi:hypothetical protein